MPDLDIIIVNWNAGQQLRDCLESIETTTRDGFGLKRVVVVDNGSMDGSAECLDDLDLPLIVIRNTENRGFAAACNQGAADSRSDYLLFLNPDTRLFPESMGRPIRFMQLPENRDVGICGIQLTDDDHTIARTCARFPTSSMFFAKMLGLDRLFPHLFPGHFMTEWDHGDTREVDHVMGAFFLVRRSVFEKLDGFDKRFFVYFEDLDFSFRARQVGWRSYYLACVQAYHKGGGTSEQIKATRLFYSLRSRILYGYKHLAYWPATVLMLGTLLIEPFARLAFAALNRSREHAQETLNGYAMLWRAMPALFRSTTGDRRQ